MIVSFLLDIGNESVMERNLTKNTRAIMISFYDCAGVAGTIVFAFIAGALFDKVGPAAPFTLLAVLDFAFILLVMLFACCCKFRN